MVNSVDPDEMPHDAALHLGLNYLPKYTFRSPPPPPKKKKCVLQIFGDILWDNVIQMECVFSYVFIFEFCRAALSFAYALWLPILQTKMDLSYQNS